jgi:hypothetical protein
MSLLVEEHKHGLINYIDTKVKCRHLKKLTCQGALLHVFICLIPSPPGYTLYTVRTCTVVNHTGKGGRVNQREG